MAKVQSADPFVEWKKIANFEADEKKTLKL